MKWGVPGPAIEAQGKKQRLEGLRVLLAEDNPINRDVMLRWLGRLGARTDVAGTGYEVLVALDAAEYDAIIMDVQMPDMDGIEAARRVRERPGHQPRIIAVTANTLPGMRDRCVAAGMDDYLAKPVQIDTLAALLERAFATPSTPRPEATTGTQVAIAREENGILDETRLASMRKLFEDPEGFAELVDQQIADAGRLVEQMRACLRDSDFPTLERTAHSLKSTSAMFGASRLSSACAALEEAASSGHAADVEAMVERVQDEESTARAALLRRVYEHLLKEVSACA
jgi:CheY-like chemotaxis protein